MMNNYNFVNKNLIYRTTILDSITKRIVDEILIPAENFDKNTVKGFIHSNLKDLPLKGVVTDAVKYYPEIIDKLGVPHQQCTFHKMQNLMTPLTKITNKIKAHEPKMVLSFIYF